MTDEKQLIRGEFRRKLDERFRLSLPSEFVDLFPPKSDWVIVKERPGCVSIWEQKTWQENLDDHIDLIQKHLKLGHLHQKMSELQIFGRLLSTRYRPLQMAGRGRLVVPEGFREFLGVEAEKDAMIIGAATCIEIWHPQKWIQYVEKRIPKYQKLLDRLLLNESSRK